MTKAVLSVSMACLLVWGLIVFPFGAYADEQQPIDSVDQLVEDNASSVSQDDQTVDFDGGTSEEGVCVNIAGRSENSSLDSEDEMFSADFLPQGDPARENSWRYRDGVSVSGGDELGSDNNDSARSIVQSPEGNYNVFDWFDRFSAGYCSGVGAAKGIDVSKHQGGY